MSLETLKQSIEEKFGIPYEKFIELEPEVITEIIESKIKKKLKPDYRAIIDGIPIDDKHVITETDLNKPKKLFKK